MPEQPGERLPLLHRWFGGALSGRGFLPVSIALMVLFYAVLYHPYSEQGLPGRVLGAYLRFVARGSATLLGWFGEDISVQGTTVLGRFPYVVVLDCAALDAQALFAAAVLAFPVPLRDKLVGLAAGLSSIWCINVIRLALLYFAGAHSLELFQVLHEEVFVLLVILSVCALFVVWARWAHARASVPAAARGADAW
jgi:exosortase/archaeosortase family protein